MPLKLFGGLRPNSRAGVLRDALAGVTLASMNVPQVLGYARIAGMPVVAGLYTVLLPPVLFAIFGSSRHLVVAADSATAAILSGALSQTAAPSGAKYVALAQMVALLTAGLLLLARLFRLGFLADFLSRTVLVGFLAGVAVQVGIAMLGDMLGIAVPAHNTLAQAWRWRGTSPTPMCRHSPCRRWSPAASCSAVAPPRACRRPCSRWWRRLRRVRRSGSPHAASR